MSAENKEPMASGGIEVDGGGGGGGGVRVDGTFLKAAHVWQASEITSKVFSRSRM